MKRTQVFNISQIYIYLNSESKIYQFCYVRQNISLFTRKVGLVILCLVIVMVKINYIK